MKNEYPNVLDAKSGNQGSPSRATLTFVVGILSGIGICWLFLEASPHNVNLRVTERTFKVRVSSERNADQSQIMAMQNTSTEVKEEPLEFPEQSELLLNANAATENIHQEEREEFATTSVEVVEKEVAVTKSAEEAEQNDTGTKSVYVDEKEDEKGNCDASWEEFRPGTKLGEWPQYRKMPQTALPSAGGGGNPLLHSEALGQLFIHPPSNFLFCYIPKNGCSQWTTVLSKVFYNDTSWSHANYMLTHQSQNKYGGASKVKEMMLDSNVNKAVFVRDPLARFASAFLNKCYAEKCGDHNCYARTWSQSSQAKHGNVTTYRKGQRVPFSLALDWIHSQDVSKVNGHYRRQTDLCGLKHNLPFFNIFGRVSKRTMSRDAGCMMERCGIDQFNVREDKDNPESSTPFWVPHKEMKIGVNQYRSAHDEEEELLKKMYTPEAARKMIQLYQQDYDILHLPEPDWIQDATGEWMDAVDHHQCYFKDKQGKFEYVEGDYDG